MGTPFIAEVKIISWNFAPKGWAFCNGQLLPVAQNQALFAVISNTYGGDGRTTFALPNLQARTVNGSGTGQGLPNFAYGQSGGEASHTLTVAEMPSHIHTLSGSSASPNATSPAAALLGAAPTPCYNQANTNLSPLTAGTVGSNIGDQAHSNMQPYLVLNFIVALQGIFPSRS